MAEPWIGANVTAPAPGSVRIPKGSRLRKRCALCGARGAGFSRIRRQLAWTPWWFWLVVFTFCWLAFLLRPIGLLVFSLCPACKKADDDRRIARPVMIVASCIGTTAALGAFFDDHAVIGAVILTGTAAAVAQTYRRFSLGRRRLRVLRMDDISMTLVGVDRRAVRRRA